MFTRCYGSTLCVGLSSDFLSCDRITVYYYKSSLDSNPGIKNFLGVWNGDGSSYEDGMKPG